jgi:hypothetical protein
LESVAFDALFMDLLGEENGSDFGLNGNEISVKNLQKGSKTAKVLIPALFGFEQNFLYDSTEFP